MKALCAFGIAAAYQARKPIILFAVTHGIARLRQNEDDPVAALRQSVFDRNGIRQCPVIIIRIADKTRSADHRNGGRSLDYPIVVLHNIRFREISCLSRFCLRRDHRKIGRVLRQILIVERVFAVGIRKNPVNIIEIDI